MSHVQSRSALSARQDQPASPGPAAAPAAPPPQPRRRPDEIDVVYRAVIADGALDEGLHLESFIGALLAEYGCFDDEIAVFAVRGSDDGRGVRVVAVLRPAPDGSGLVAQWL